MYKLAVKLEGIERRKRTTGVLHIAAGLYLLLKSINYLELQQYQHIGYTIPFFAAALLSLLYGFLKKRYDPRSRLNRWVRLVQVCGFALLAINFAAFDTFSVMLLFAWAVGCLLLMFTERKVFHDAEMLFNQDGIFIPGYFTNRRLFWNTIADVVIRPDFVTIFHANDRFMQYEVLKKLAPAALDEIALYCKEQLRQSGVKIEKP